MAHFTEGQEEARKKEVICYPGRAKIMISKE